MFSFVPAASVPSTPVPDVDAPVRMFTLALVLPVASSTFVLPLPSPSGVTPGGSGASGVSG